MIMRPNLRPLRLILRFFLSASLSLFRRQSRCSSQPGLSLDKNSKEVKREGEREKIGKEQCSLVTDHEEDKRKYSS